uniref:G-protein coupled receptors family 1 profile domain-containing protein n=1 Tax=Pelusios castaneus TaxID=367368 RepID=A0A8C8RQP4_9SAUR
MTSSPTPRLSGALFIIGNHPLLPAMPLKSTHQLSLAVFMVTFITGLPLNLLALCIFVVKARQRLLPADVLLLNLTVSDLLLLAFLPIRIAEVSWEMKWRMPDFLCPFFGFLFFSSIYLTTLTLTGVSIDRYLSVAFPLRYKAGRRPAYALMAVALFWVLAFAHCSVVYVVQYQNKGNSTAGNPTTCYTSFTEQQLAILLPVRLEMFLVLFCLPLCITTFCYARFIIIICSLPLVKAGRKRRAIGLAATTFLIFVVCFTPFNISHVVGYNESPKWRVYALLPSTLNASLDPAIFYFSSTAVQRAFADCLASLRHRLRAIMTQSYTREPPFDTGKASCLLLCTSGEDHRPSLDTSIWQDLELMPSSTRLWTTYLSVRDVGRSCSGLLLISTGVAKESRAFLCCCRFLRTHHISAYFSFGEGGPTSSRIQPQCQGCHNITALPLPLLDHE